MIGSRRLRRISQAGQFRPLALRIVGFGRPGTFLSRGNESDPIASGFILA